MSSTNELSVADLKKWAGQVRQHNLVLEVTEEGLLVRRLGFRQHLVNWLDLTMLRFPRTALEHAIESVLRD